jgi:hypothetical protein
MYAFIMAVGKKTGGDCLMLLYIDSIPLEVKSKETGFVHRVRISPTCPLFSALLLLIFVAVWDL